MGVYKVESSLVYSPSPSIMGRLRLSIGSSDDDGGLKVSKVVASGSICTVRMRSGLVTAGVSASLHPSARLLLDGVEVTVSTCV